MLEILLIVQMVICLLLITVILLQKTGSDSLSGLSGGGTSGVVSARAAANFLTHTTLVLATLFILNSIVLANLSSSSKEDTVIKEIQKEEAEANTVPEVK